MGPVKGQEHAIVHVDTLPELCSVEKQKKARGVPVCGDFVACVGLLAALGFAASRWPRFVELAWGLGFRTLFSGNGGVNTKGLVQRVASLTLSVYVQAKLVVVVVVRGFKVDGWVGLSPLPKKKSNILL